MLRRRQSADDAEGVCREEQSGGEPETRLARPLSDDRRCGRGRGNRDGEQGAAVGERELVGEKGHEAEAPQRRREVPQTRLAECPSRHDQVDQSDDERSERPPEPRMELGREDVDRDDRGDEGDDCDGSRREAEPGRRLPPDAKQDARREQPSRPDEQRRPGPPVRQLVDVVPACLGDDDERADERGGGEPLRVPPWSDDGARQGDERGDGAEGEVPGVGVERHREDAERHHPEHGGARQQRLDDAGAALEQRCAERGEEGEHADLARLPIRLRRKQACGRRGGGDRDVGMAVEASTDVWNSSPTGSVTASRYARCEPEVRERRELQARVTEPVRED